MSLEDKIMNPMVPADSPGQRSDPLPKAGKKRRKSGGTAATKVKNSDLEDEVGRQHGGTDSAGDEGRRPQKKMLFESASEGATLSFAGPAIRRETPRPAPVVATAPAPAAKTPQPAEPAPAPVVAMPAAAATEEIVPPAPEAPAPKWDTKDFAAVAAPKAPVQVPRWPCVNRRQPEPEDEVQAELPLTVESVADDVAETAQDAAALAAETHKEESADESLTLAFDATLADGLAERTAVAQEDTESEPAAPALAAEPAAPQPVEPPPAIETVHTAEPPPAPPVVEPQPAPAYVAPVAEEPKVEPKPESETPNRGLSRSEAMIARATRMSARATPRPVPTAAETLAAARTAQQQLRSADLPKTPGDIYGYWARVKNGRRFPSRADFDADQVAENWPNSMLLTCGNGAGSNGNFSSVLRLGANRRTRPGEDLNFTSMITEWILATGGEAARAGTPVQDTEVFPTPDGTHAYKIVALPLSENQTRVDHVLCHLSRS
jgi:hypothetical protein